MRPALAAVLLALSALVAWQSLPALRLDPAAFPDPMRDTWWQRRDILLLHMATALPALLLGPLQLLRHRSHAALGHAYAALAVVGSLSGLSLAVTAFGGTAARLGFAAMALAWLLTTVLGWQRDREHGRWMARSYAVCFGAVSLRLGLLATAALGLPYAGVYPWLAWLCWVPNLAAVEVALRAGAKRAA